jgi:hypothetical protein
MALGRAALCLLIGYTIQGIFYLYVWSQKSYFLAARLAIHL